MSQPLWTPTPEQIEAARMTAFRRFAQQRHGLSLPDYPALYRWSLAEPAAFWQDIWDFCGVVADRPADAVLANFDDMLAARCFPGAQLNYARNLLRWGDDRQALVFWNEQGRRRVMSYAELAEQAGRLAAAMRAWGVEAGDRVAAMVPNVPEAVIGLLAAASIGAIWSSCSPDFGFQGVLDRFGQIAPRVLLAADGYIYGGREFDCLPRLREIRPRLPSLRKVLLIPYLAERPALEGLGDAVLWPDALAGATPRAEYAPLPFDHPIYILYSSGTTGPPKCIVHRAGGVLLQHLKEHVLHTDLGRDDRLFYFTTCGWMMWNWLVGALATGCTVVLYDGSPLSPNPTILWDLAQQERITVLGTSPRFLTALEKAGLAPRDSHDLSALRAILSTGAPLSGESFDYVYARIKPDVRLSSISGGTDLCACFAAGNPILPVYRGEIQCRALGMDVRVYDEQGRSLQGRQGELVCAAAFPSLPLGFWNDADGTAYRRAYFQRYPGVWHHGDFAELTEHDGMIIYGRSDAVLNPGGVRIGTAEIYRLVEQLPEVLESVAVAQSWRGDVRIVLFVKLRTGALLDEHLVQRIKDHIRRSATPRHVPAKVLAVPDIPRTKSGKIVELAVRDVVHGRSVNNVEALANPEALDHFRQRPELAVD